MLDSKDMIIRQIQQFVARLLRQALELMQVPTQRDMTMILEELSGLDMSELQSMGEPTLVYLLKLRAEGELRETMVQALELQAILARDDATYGPAERWERLAAAVEA